MGDILVYLAGPVTGLTWEQATSWRERAAGVFAPEIKVLSPLRYQPHLSEEAVLSNSYHGNLLSSPRGIGACVSDDIRRCSAMLVNYLGAKTIVSRGTIFEIGGARILNKLIVVAIENDNIHRDAMLEDATPFIVDNLDEATRILRAILIPSV